MIRRLHEQLEAEVPKRLADLLTLPPAKVRVDQEPAADSKAGQIDLIAYVGDHIFIVECKAGGEAAPTAIAARKVKQFAQHFKKKAIPLVAVPFMGDVGRHICDAEG